MDNMIRKAACIAVSLILACAGAATVSAQDYVNTPVSISKEKVRINGKVCYSHIVLERQTLFSISKAYNVSIDDIYKFNPTLEETGLIKNSIIIIPSENALNAMQAAKPEKNDDQSEKQETIKEDNEKKPEEIKKDEPKKAKKKKIHTVKWYENLNDIAARYGITKEALMAANNLTGNKLKSRMKLTIPEPGEYAEEVTEETEAAVPADTNIAVTHEPQEIVEEKAQLPWWHGFRKENITASLLLPMKATGTSASWSNMDFYSGVLLAINDLAQEGINVDLSVHDIASGNLETAGSDIASSDIVIGPVSSKDLTNLLNANTGSFVISPLDPKAASLASVHKNFVQVPTPHKVQYDDLAAWIKEEKGPDDKVLFITEKGARLTAATNEMKMSIDSSGINYNTFSYSILEGRDITQPLRSLMTQEGVNRVMIASESEAFVNDVVRNMNVMIHQKYNVVLYGASKIRSFETIEVENFHKTNLHVSLTYYIDYNDPRVKNFLLKYRALYNTEPSQFAFQGYDIASYFLEMATKYGKRWPEMLQKEEKSMLQSTFRCVQEGEEGYVNNGVRRIIYGTDWSVRKIK